MSRRWRLVVDLDGPVEVDREALEAGAREALDELDFFTVRDLEATEILPRGHAAARQAPVHQVVATERDEATSRGRFRCACGFAGEWFGSATAAERDFARHAKEGAGAASAVPTAGPAEEGAA